MALRKDSHFYVGKRKSFFGTHHLTGYLTMQITVLKSKIHRATITDANLHYEGSITLPRELVEQAGLHLHEKVLIANVDNGNRFDTYVILGDEGGICLNGAAAHLGKAGDRVIIMAWAQIDEKEASSFTPKVVYVDEKNRPKKLSLS